MRQYILLANQYGFSKEFLAKTRTSYAQSYAQMQFTEKKKYAVHLSDMMSILRRHPNSFEDFKRVISRASGRHRRRFADSARERTLRTDA